MRNSGAQQGMPSDRGRLANALAQLTLDGFTVRADLPYLVGHAPREDEPGVVYWAKASAALAFSPATGRLVRPFHLHYTGSERQGARIRQRLREAGLRPVWTKAAGAPFRLDP